MSKIKIKLYWTFFLIFPKSAVISNLKSLYGKEVAQFWKTLTKFIKKKIKIEILQRLV